jgi:pectate lyase
MKLERFAWLCALIHGVNVLAQNEASFDLVGYGKDNPLGETTGGRGGTTTTVSSKAALQTAITGNDPRVIYVQGNINLGGRMKVGSNKSIIGVGTTANLTAGGFNINSQTNVIIRNLKISYATGDDGMTIQNSTRLWIDHNEFQSNITLGPDYYVREQRIEVGCLTVTFI